MNEQNIKNGYCKMSLFSLKKILSRYISGDIIISSVPNEGLTSMSFLSVKALPGYRSNQTMHITNQHSINNKLSYFTSINNQDSVSLLTNY
jgi:hypothetical protein